MSEAFTFESWRNAVRPLLVAGKKADTLLWSDFLSKPPTNAAPADGLRLPRALMALLENLACYRHESRWELMYRLAWRTRFENAQLLADTADPDVSNATSMAREVGRDLHKMHAFVRFREVASDEARPNAPPSYYAWFEPQHEILRKGARFFARRFPNMLWTIATPDGAAVWDMTALQFVDSGDLRHRPTGDAHEDLWRTYYRSICNPSRINPRAMQREMPQHYWRNLPEAAEIPTLLREGNARFAARHREGDHDHFDEAKSVQRSLAPVRTPAGGVQACRACGIWKHATQAVEGQGPKTAEIMIVGEQPGDEEDLRGAPFVGPAGRVLDEALRSAGLERGDVYITNAVKHFKWEPRGKRRLHKRPSVEEIRACGGWLRTEIEAVKPAIIVALGASALNALTGTSVSIQAARGMELVLPTGARIVATYHPSAILRADAARGAALRSALVEDLTRARTGLAGTAGVTDHG